MIDWTRVTELCGEVGAEDLDEVVELFFEEVEEITTRLRAAPDLATLEADLHFLKGSALSLGFRDFAELCQTGETASASGDASTVDVPTILQSYDTSKTIFLDDLPRMIAA